MKFCINNMAGMGALLLSLTLSILSGASYASADSGLIAETRNAQDVQSVTVSHGSHNGLVEVMAVNVEEGAVKGRTPYCSPLEALPESLFVLLYCTEDDLNHEVNFTFEDVEGNLLFELDYVRSLDENEGFVLSSNRLAELVAKSSDPSIIKMKMLGAIHGEAQQPINCLLSFNPSEAVQWTMNGHGRVVYGLQRCELWENGEYVRSL